MRSTGGSKGDDVGGTKDGETAGGMPNFRLSSVSGGLAGELPLGSRTLNNQTLAGGVTEGGSGASGVGGGMGIGGASFNEGTLILNGVPLSTNQTWATAGAHGRVE